MPVVSELEVTFRAVPLVVLTDVRFSKLPVPVVLEPIKSITLPVKPVVVPDCVTFNSEAVVCAEAELEILTALPVVRALAETFKAVPAEVLALEILTTFAAPVVLEPVKLATLPV